MKRNSLTLSSLGVILLATTQTTDAAPSSISSQDWKKVVQPHRSETYLVSEGETLKSISKKLFGNEKYWVNILEINKGSINNPDQIDPGTILIFSSAPKSQTKKTARIFKSEPASTKRKPQRIFISSADPLEEDPQNRPSEWKSLPKQNWESDIAVDLSHLDQNNFDLRSTTVRARGLTSYEPHFIPASEKLPSLGQIIGGQASSHYFMIYDLVFIHAKDHMKIGDVYAITQEPIWISNGTMTPGGYAYYILGKVKIIGVQENVFLGTIISAKHLVSRTNTLIPVPAKIPEMNPVAGPRPLSARLLLNREYTEGLTVQNREVFIDHGTEDGVQPGMVFRAYINSDPNNDGSLRDSDFVINADILVTQVSENFSTGIILHSRNMVKHGSKIVLLTDVSDVSKHLGFSQRGGDNVDEIDLLDQRDTPDNKEAEEIKQLENWKGNPVPTRDQKQMRAILERTAEEKDLPDPLSLKTTIPNPNPLPLVKEGSSLTPQEPSPPARDASSSSSGTQETPNQILQNPTEPIAPVPPPALNESSPSTPAAPPALKGANLEEGTPPSPSRDISSVSSSSPPPVAAPSTPAPETSPNPQAPIPPMTQPLTPSQAPPLTPPQGPPPGSSS